MRYAVCIIACLSKPLFATEFSSKLELFAIYDPISIYDFFGDWNSRTYTGGDFLWHYARLQTGVTHKNWRYSLVANDIAMAHFSEDTAELQMRTANNLALDESGYDIFVDFKRIQYYGFELAHILKLGTNMTFLSRLSILNATHLNSGIVFGQVNPASPTDYDYGNLYIDYHYNQDPLFNEAKQDVQGQGLSFSAQLDWRISPRLDFSTKVENLYGFIYWPSIPYIDARIVTDNKEYDENGYAQVQPAIAGESGTHALYFELPYSVELHSKLYITANSFITGTYAHNHYIAYFSRGFGIRNNSFLFYYEQNKDFVGHKIILNWRKVQFGFIFDELSIKNSHTIGFTLAFSLTL